MTADQPPTTDQHADRAQLGIDHCFHANHPGVAGAPDGVYCMRCEADRALAVLRARAAAADNLADALRDMERLALNGLWLQIADALAAYTQPQQHKRRTAHDPDA